MADHLPLFQLAHTINTFLKWYTRKNMTYFKNFLLNFLILLSPTRLQKMCPPKYSSWLTKELKKSIIIKSINLPYLTSTSLLNSKLNSSYRNKLHHLLQIAKRQHYITKLNESGNNMKSTWSIINAIMKKTPTNKIVCGEFQGGLESKLVTDPVEIADGFNDYFVNIGPSVAASVPHSSMTPPEIHTPPKHFRFRMVELEDTVMKLKPKGAGHDGLKPPLLKKCLPAIRKPLLHILNYSLATDCCLDEFKWATVCI